MNTGVKKPRYASKVVWGIVALPALFCVLFLFSAQEPAPVPATVVVHGDFANSEAQLLYNSTERGLRGLFRRRVWAELKAGRFKLLWHDVQSGPEQITAIAKEPDGSFVIQATNGSRSPTTLTIHRGALTAATPFEPWRAHLLGKQTGYNVNVNDRYGDPARESTTKGAETNSTSSAAAPAR